MADLELSIIVPVHNEQDNVVPLMEEIKVAMGPDCAYEAIFIDDLSDDDTAQVLKDAKNQFETLRVLIHKTNCGQSSAIRTGVLAAKGRLIATLDGDGQNDPADIPLVLARYKELESSSAIGMVSGRRKKRQDTWIKRYASKLGNNVRRSLLRDQATDTGCALKVFARDTYLLLPYFDHMHRYFSALMQREGYTMEFVDVNHRQRLHGVSNYGILDRLWVSMGDIAGMMWLQRRGRISKNTKEL
jgi:dolichol-phosphate mannosyltransferase